MEDACAKTCADAGGVVGLTDLGTCDCLQYTGSCVDSCLDALPLVTCQQPPGTANAEAMRLAVAEATLTGEAVGYVGVAAPTYVLTYTVNGSTWSEELPDCAGHSGECSSTPFAASPLLFATNEDGTAATEAVFPDRAFYESLCYDSGTAAARDRRARRSRVRRELNTSGYPTVPSAIACVPLGGTVLFALDPDDRTNFPIYSSSALNTNLDFDHGAFQALHSKMTQTTEPYGATFAHVFTEHGFYVFESNGYPELQTYVQVQPAGMVCTSTAVPPTMQGLVEAGAQLSDVHEDPDWILIAIVIGTLLGVVVLTLALLTVLRPRFQGRYGGTKALPEGDVSAPPDEAHRGLDAASRRVLGSIFPSIGWGDGPPASSAGCRRRWQVPHWGAVAAGAVAIRSVPARGFQRAHPLRQAGGPEDGRGG